MYGPRLIPLPLRLELYSEVSQVSDPWKEEAGGLAFPPVGRSVLGSITARLLLTFLFSVLSDPLPPPGWAMCPRRDHCTNYVGRFSFRFFRRWRIHPNYPRFGSAQAAPRASRKAASGLAEDGKNYRRAAAPAGAAQFETKLKSIRSKSPPSSTSPARRSHEVKMKVNMKSRLVKMKRGSRHRRVTDGSHVARRDASGSAVQPRLAEPRRVGPRSVGGAWGFRFPRSNDDHRLYHDECLIPKKK